MTFKKRSGFIIPTMKTSQKLQERQIKNVEFYYSNNENFSKTSGTSNKKR